MEIELCKQCNGEGNYKFIGESNKAEYWEYKECSNCNSTGRVFKVNFTKEFPFTDDYKEKAQIVNFEEKISKLIRDEKSN